MINIDKDLSSIQEARTLAAQARKAQEVMSTFSQAQLDEIVARIARVAASHAQEWAKNAVEETGYGNVADKVTKNLFASEFVYDFIKDMATVGIINEDHKKKTVDVGVPLGVIAALVPSTNPTSTAIYKTLIAIKAGNGIVFSPHPGARKCTQATIKVLKEAAEEAGAPTGIIACMETLTLQGTTELMQSPDVALILATGGAAMVKAAYSSGTPTISGGPGNAPAFIERSADIKKSVKQIIDSKTFDNGVICASEQSIVVEKCIEDKVIEELKLKGAYFLSDQESEKIAQLLVFPNGAINQAVVGKKASELAEKAGFSVPNTTSVLIAKENSVSRDNPFSREKLCPVLAFYSEKDWVAGCERSLELLRNEGQGHTLVIHSQNEDVIREFILRKPVSRVLINTPAALGGIGASTNISPALTLGCGAVGGGSTSDNISPLNLINIKKAAYGVREIEDLSAGNSEQVSELNSEASNINSYGLHTRASTDVGFDTRFIEAFREEKVDTRFSAPHPLSNEPDTRFCTANQALRICESDPVQAVANDKAQQVERLLGEVIKRINV